MRREQRAYGEPPSEEHMLRISEVEAFHPGSSIDGIEGPVRPEIAKWYEEEDIRFNKQQAEFSARYNAGLVPKREIEFGRANRIAAQPEPAATARQERRALVRA